MKSIPKQNKKIKLGKKTAHGYEYSSKINFNEDISLQLAQIIEETDIEEALEKEIKSLRGLIKNFSQKEKNLQYYYEVGRKLLFLDSRPFEEVAIGSVFRRIVEELPEVVPKNINNKEMAIRHLYFMYWIGHIKKKTDLSQASWDQWFEITKFRNLYKKPEILAQILKECKSGRLSGHESLNKKIKELIKTFDKKSENKS